MIMICFPLESCQVWLNLAQVFFEVMKMWKVNNDGENNDRRRTFFSDKPFKFGSGELLIIKATDAIRAVTGPNMQKISDSNVSKQIWVIYIYTQSNYKLFMLFHSGDNLPYEVWDTTLCLLLCQCVELIKCMVWICGLKCSYLLSLEWSVWHLSIHVNMNTCTQ